MHGTFERSRETRDNIHRRPAIGFLVVPVLIAVALVGLAITKPVVSRWISEAAQAESGQTPQVDPVVRTVRAN
jgi:hypothetical protein